MQQDPLFQPDPPASAALPEGLLYEPNFLQPEEERNLLGLLRQLPLAEARYKDFIARRQVLSFGGSFDYDTNRLKPAAPLIPALFPLSQKVAEWACIQQEDICHVLVAHYPPGASLGWHRDVPDFEAVFGVSLGTPAVLRFRPYPPVQPKAKDVKRLIAEPRSIYAMRGPARWSWQHSVGALDASRYSITFRTTRSLTEG